MRNHSSNKFEAKVTIVTSTASAALAVPSTFKGFISIGHHVALRTVPVLTGTSR